MNFLYLNLYNYNIKLQQQQQQQKAKRNCKRQDGSPEENQENKETGSWYWQFVMMLN